MRGNRALWRRCRRLAAGPALPEPFDPRAFLDGIAESRGRPIEVLPAALGPDAPCGVLVSTDHADYICYPADTTALHAEHILLHEVGHLLCGHEGDAVLAGSAAMRALVPDLPAELVRRVLGRTGYTQRQEMEAELVATLLAQRVRVAGRGSGGGVEAIFGAGPGAEITGPNGTNGTGPPRSGFYNDQDLANHVHQQILTVAVADQGSRADG